MESDSLTGEERLKKEYAKLKAHNTVLKRAVLEEQDKVTSLETSLKAKDQYIRKVYFFCSDF